MNKTIHYIWLGGKKKPRVIRKCIASWKKHMPDWEIKEWNETNINLDKYTFAKEAYNAKKYAFAADVIRFDVLYQEGGLYFDTDVKVLRDFTPLTDKYLAFTGHEGININPGLVLYAAQPHNPIIAEMLEIYRQTHFIVDGKENTKVVGDYFSEILEKYGFVYEDIFQQCGEFIVFPRTYFCPTDGYGNPVDYSENTYSVHLFASSWRPFPVRTKNAVKRICYKTFGLKRIQKVKKFFRKKKNEDI